jgi:hypothetical protein
LACSSLRGTSNQLLAYTALFEMLHQTAHFTFLLVATTGTNFIPFQLSMYWQLHSVFGMCAAQMVMLLTALDRLVAIAAPILYGCFTDEKSISILVGFPLFRHNRLSGRRCYLAVLLLCCAFVGLYFVQLTVQTAHTHWNVFVNVHFSLFCAVLLFRPVTGLFGDLFMDEMQQAVLFLLVVGLLNIAIYVLVWVVVKAKTSSSCFYNFIYKTFLNKI